MPLDLDAGSRFQFTPTVQVTMPNGDLVETYGAWRMPSFIKKRPSEDAIGRYLVSGGLEGRPDKISAEIYGTQYLDWILLAFNSVGDTMNWPKAGTVLEYPLPRIVFAEID